MADFNALQALINAYIKKNGVQAITGQILNGILNGMVTALGKGYTIAGSADPTTDPGTMTGPLAYIAYTAGTYTHFGGLEVEQGEVAMLIYNEDLWHKEVLFSLAAAASVDANVGTPSVDVSFVDGLLTFDFHNMKGNPGVDGEDGDAAGFGTVNATVDSNVGTPGVTVQSSGPNTAKNFTFQFTNLKGETGVTSVVATVDNTSGNPQCAVSLNGQQLTLAFTGLKGAQGDTGSSVDYPFTIVNNLTTNDATQALSAAMGVQLESEVSQLEAEVTDLEDLRDELIYKTGKTTITKDNFTLSGIYKTTDNTISSNSNYKSTPIYNVNPGDVFVWTNFPTPNDSDFVLALYDKDDNPFVVGTNNRISWGAVKNSGYLIPVGCTKVGFVWRDTTFPMTASSEISTGTEYNKLTQDAVDMTRRDTGVNEMDKRLVYVEQDIESGQAENMLWDGILQNSVVNQNPAVIKDSQNFKTYYAHLKTGNYKMVSPYNGGSAYNTTDELPKIGVATNNDYATANQGEERFITITTECWLVYSVGINSDAPVLTKQNTDGVGFKAYANESTLGFSVVREIYGTESNKAISNVDGTLVSAGTKSVSDYVAVIPNSKIIVLDGVFQTANVYASIAFYSDNEGTFVSCINNTTWGKEILGLEVIVPNSAKFMRIYAAYATRPARIMMGRTVDERISTLELLADQVPTIVKTPSDFTTTGLWKASVAEIDSSYVNYSAIALFYVSEGQIITFHKWQQGSALASVAAVFCYDNDGLPFNGVSARRDYSDMQTKDYTTGEYTFKVPTNCSQIGLAFNFNAYPAQTGAEVIIQEESVALTDLAKTLINNAVEQGDEVGDDSAKYYLKGNSNIVYDAAKKLGIIAAGQSNIDGRNSYSDLPAGFVNPNAKVHFKDSKDDAFTSFEVTDGGAGNDWSFDAIVYNLLTDSSHGNLSDIYVMKKSMGGTSIDPMGATSYHWTADYEFLDSPSASLLRSFEEIVRAGIASNGSAFEIKALLWHQGEGDMQNEEVANRYYDNLKNMLAYIRGVVGNPRLYVFCGNISLNRTSPGYVNIINGAYTKLASEDPYLKVVDMSNAALEDGYHFDYEWSIYFGEKVYDLMIDAGIITGTKINPSEPS